MIIPPGRNADPQSRIVGLAGRFLHSRAPSSRRSAWPPSGSRAGARPPSSLIDPVVLGPFFEAKNFTGVPRLPAKLQRVVLLPVAGTPGTPIEALASFDQVMLADLATPGAL